jgi:DnaJ-domain-containing protein 1
VVAFVIMVRLGLIRVAAVGALLLAMLRWLGLLLLRLSPFLLPWSSRRFTRPAEAHDRPDSGESASPPKKTEMTRDEALAILGLTEGATDDEVRVAYAALIKKVHPDQGGSAYLAARVNLARDRLLSKSKR